MVKGLVSIIVTCFNQETIISKVVDSIKLQTYSNWECIIVNDGSTDKSQSVLESIVRNDSRFNLINQPNQGVASARNKGFEAAKGEYVQFLDGDDTLLSQKIEKQVKFLDERNDYSVVICDHQYYYEPSGSIKYYAFEPIQEYPLDQLLFKWHDGVASPPHAPLYRRSIWANGEYPYPVDYEFRCEDWVFNVLVALEGARFYFQHEILCNYHISESNYTSSKLNLGIAAIRAAIYLKDRIPEEKENEFIETTIRNSMNFYKESERQNILKSSRQWRIVNALTSPFVKILRQIK